MTQEIETIGGFSPIQGLQKPFHANSRTDPSDKLSKDLEAGLRVLKQQSRCHESSSAHLDDPKFNPHYGLKSLVKAGVVVMTTTAAYVFAKTIGFLPSWTSAKKEIPSTAADAVLRNDQKNIAVQGDHNDLGSVVSAPYGHEGSDSLSFRERGIVKFEEIEVEEIPLSEQAKDDEEDVIEIDTATVQPIRHSRQLLDAPSVQNPIADQEISVGEPLHVLLNHVFSDFQTLNATLSTGGPLPSWLSLSFISRPTLLGIYNTPEDANDVAVTGTTAFVADVYGGLQIIDVSDPSTPILLGSYDPPGVFAYGVTVSGATAFVVGLDRGLQIIDVSDSSAPTFLGSYNTSNAYGVAVIGTRAFVADRDSGLHIIDVSDPAASTLLGSYNTPGIARDVVVIGTTAFVADRDSGLQIIDVSDPRAPAFLGSYDTPGFAYGVTVIGTTAFVADYDRGLQIIDVSDPRAPALLGFYGTPSFAYDVIVKGTTAFVADSGSGVQIIDVRDPSTPTFLGSYDTPGSIYHLTVRGTTAFLAEYGYGLKIIDIGDWLLSGTPASGDQGSLLVRITADDGLGGAVDEIFHLTVTNTAPTLDNLLSDQSTPLGTSFIYQVSSFIFSDLDGDVLAYTAAQSDGSALPNWLIFDSATRTFSGTPQSGDQGIYQIKVTVDDGFGGTVEDVFQLTVLNRSPEAIIPLSSQLGNLGLESIHVGQQFDFQLQEFSFIDEDDDRLTYHATLAGGAPLPNWMSFDPVHRRFTGTPQAGDQAVLAITVTAEDGFGGTISDTFVLTVANRAPIEGSIPDQMATINQVFGYQVPPGTLTDLDGDVLIYSAALSNGNPLPPWLSFDSGNQTFSGTPGLFDRGVISVRVFANDGRATGSVDFILEVGNVAPQVVNPLSDQLLQESIPIGSTFRFQFSSDSFRDPDGDVLLYTATHDIGSSLPSWLTFDANTRTFSGTPQSGDQGVYTITVHADDGFGGVISDSFPITVANQAPIVEGNLNNQTNTVGQYLSYTINTTLFLDPDGDSLQYMATLSDGTPLPSWLTFNPETKTFTGTPLSGSQGAFAIRVTGQDGYGESVENGFRIDILNQGPIVTSQLPEQRVAAGQSFSFPLPSSLMIDPDGDSLHYTATLSDGSSLPGWLNFDPITRTFTGTPQSPETLAIKIRAEDPYGEHAETAFDVTIQAGTAGNIPPTLTHPIQDQQAGMGALFEFTFDSQTFADGNGDMLRYEARLGNGDPLPGWLNFDESSRTFRGTPSQEDLGEIEVVVAAMDPQELAAIDTFTITVVDTTNYAAVVINPIPKQTADVGSDFRFTIPDTTFHDPNGDTLRYSVSLASLPDWLHFDPDTRTLSGTPGRGDTDTYGNRDHVIEVTATDGQLATSTKFIISVAGMSTSELAVKVGAPLGSALLFFIGLYKKRGMFINPFRKRAYQKQEETVITGGLYQRVLAVPSHEIKRVIAKINRKGRKSKKDNLPGPGEENLPGWLRYNHETSKLFGTPDFHDIGTVTIQVLGVAGIIKEQFDLTVQEQVSAMTEDNIEMQPMIDENQSGNYGPT